MNARVVLAYSGGLDTSVAIPYLAKMTGGDVVAVSLDLGQGGEDMESVRQRALDCGAVESIVIDAKDEFADEYCLPTIQANGMYMKQYPLVSAISRPLITKHLVQAGVKKINYYYDYHDSPLAIQLLRDSGVPYEQIKLDRQFVEELAHKLEDGSD